MMVSAVGISIDGIRIDPFAAGPSRIGSAIPPAACLVVTGNASLRGRVRSVAEITEWTVCDTPTTAEELRAAVDRDYDLVIVDIASPCGDRVSDSVALAEVFSGRQGTLLVVSSSGESVDEELWARQLGVWAYLPGMSTGDSLVSLFREAGRMSARWMARMGASAHRMRALTGV
jgi:DNA-binding response OmpR family regulator